MSTSTYVYGDIKFLDNSTSNYVSVKAPSTITSSWNMVLPTNSGSINQYLVNSSTPGQLTWITSTGDIYTKKSSLTSSDSPIRATIDMTSNSINDVITMTLDATSIDPNNYNPSIFKCVRNIRKTGASTLSENVIINTYKTDDWSIDMSGSLYRINLVPPVALIKSYNIRILVQDINGSVSPVVSFV